MGDAERGQGHRLVQALLGRDPPVLGRWRLRELHDGRGAGPRAGGNPAGDD